MCTYLDILQGAAVTLNQEDQMHGYHCVVLQITKHHELVEKKRMKMVALIDHTIFLCLSKIKKDFWLALWIVFYLLMQNCVDGFSKQVSLSTVKIHFFLSKVYLSSYYQNHFFAMHISYLFFMWYKKGH